MQEQDKLDPTVLCEKCKDLFIPHTVYPPIPLDVIRSNLIPSKTDIKHVAAIVEVEETELEQYESELARLRRIMDKLEAEKSALSERIERRKSWMSPIRKLPNEILDIIMSATCLSNRYTLSISPKTNTLQAYPYNLSHVSSHWRSIVTSCPRMWTSFHVDVFGLRRDIQPLLQVYLKNSRDLPLRVRIVDSGKWSADFGEDYANHLGLNGVSACSTLLSQSTRIQSLTMDVRGQIFSVLRPTSSSWDPPFAFPLLRTFHNYTNLTHIAVGSTWFWNAILAAPMLNSLAAAFVSHAKVYPFAQITSLVLMHISSIRVLLRILVQCPNLKALEVRQDRMTVDPEILNDTRPPTTLSNLKHLTVISRHENGPAGFYPLFKGITVPILNDLTIRSSKIGIHDWRSGGFLDMVQRSSCPMKNLTIELPTVVPAQSASMNTNEAFVEIFSQCPMVARLRIIIHQHHLPEGDEGSDDETHSVVLGLLSALPIISGSSLDTSSSTLCPKLRMFHLIIYPKPERSGVNDNTLDALFRMVESRSRSQLALLAESVTPLTYFGLHVSNNLTDEHYDALLDPFQPRLDTLEQDRMAYEIRLGKTSS
ncbi:hypothetical protein WG66_003680 [Moniliophthora roreri]|uniref:F-box domain-containing protein n=1 Tax=Moniliophthora roreri TaxID=221103 RepID=A0A0W0GAN3_MONRR|nr:hypothetical protein WG66_003680 [Moniliophthora roreri]